VRAVLDANVIISALLSPRGSPAKVLRLWLDGAYEVVVSPLLLEELDGALGYPKLRARVTTAESQELLELLRREGDLRDDPTGAPPVRSPDPGDDYLITLATASKAVIVSGDRHLLDLGADLPVYSPADFIAVIEADDR
jgi:putative PIN family toxin of toxin-antitoxin system